MGVSLWPRPRWLHNFSPPQMKIDDDLRKCVCFIGYGELNPSGDKFTAVATGFFVQIDRMNYLVTARHVAVAFGDDPFMIRLNAKDGSGVMIQFDGTREPEDKWFVHPDEDVDIAIVAFPYNLANSLDHFAMTEDWLMRDQNIEGIGVGVGDTCYAIGLFRLMQGKKRNFTIVHTGSIAAMPSDELIPVRVGKKLSYVRGYLVEMSNLRGLSGSPVIVRPTVDTIVARAESKKYPKEGAAIGHRVVARTTRYELELLGVWTGSWEASPDDVLALDHGREVRVPVGLGTVVPAQKLLEILNLPAVTQLREELHKKVALREAATQDARIMPFEET